MNKDYYKILGIDKSASLDDIKKAYRKLAMKYHPDRNNGNKKYEEKFKEINEAYEILSNEYTRTQYDNSLEDEMYEENEEETNNYDYSYNHTNNMNNETENKKSSVFWRFLKVLYFIITLPIISRIGFAVLTGQTIHRGNAYFSINDYYLGTIYLILVILGYIFFTDLLRRLISYITDGNFNGFFPYIKIIKGYFWWILIVGFFLFSFLSDSSTALRNECTGNNEGFNDYGSCICNEGYLRDGKVCKVTLEKSILNAIPYGSFLREVKEIPGEQGKYIGIYIKDYTIDKYMDTDKEMPYFSCPEEAQGQGIKGEYHIFTFENGKIKNDIKIKSFDIEYIKDNELNFSYFNTKYNNNIFFGGATPVNNSDGYKIEQTNLINFNDYNGDGIKNEFYLVNGSNNSCRHKNYTIIGYDKESNNLINYGIKWKDGTISYWGDNFIPDENGEVINGWECGDYGSDTLNGSDTSTRNYYKYNKKTKIYDYIKGENRICANSDYFLNNEIKQDVNLRDNAGVNSNVIKPIIKGEYVKIIDTTLVGKYKWSKVDYNGTIGRISDVGFQENKNIQSLVDTKKLFGYWFIPGSATINITFLDNGRFTFNDYNYSTNSDEVLTGTYELIGENLTLKYDDRPSQLFRFYKGEGDDDNYYISNVSGYYFIKQ